MGAYNHPHPEYSAQVLLQANVAHAQPSHAFTYNNNSNNLNYYIGPPNMPHVDVVYTQSPHPHNNNNNNSPYMVVPNVPVMKTFGNRVMQRQPEGFYFSPPQRNTGSLTLSKRENREDQEDEFKEGVKNESKEDDDAQSRAYFPQVNEHDMQANGQARPRMAQMDNIQMYHEFQIHPMHSEMFYQNPYGPPPAHPNAAGNFGELAPGYPMHHPMHNTHGLESCGMVAPGYPIPPPIGNYGMMEGHPTPHPNGPGHFGMPVPVGHPIPPPPYAPEIYGGMNMGYGPPPHGPHPVGPGNPAAYTLPPDSPYVNADGRVVSGRERVKASRAHPTQSVPNMLPSDEMRIAQLRDQDASRRRGGGQKRKESK